MRAGVWTIHTRPQAAGKLTKGTQMMSIDNIDEFLVIDKRIDAAEDRAADAIRESLRDRWEFGRIMLAERKGKKLPDGYLEKLVETIGKSRSELKYRMQFAERYPTEDELANAIGQFPSWAQVIKNLPKQPEDGASPKPKPPHKPIPHPKHDEVVELHEQGATRGEIAETTGINPRTVDRIVREERIEETAIAEAAPVDWNTIPGNQRAKLDRAKASIRREVEKEFRTRLLAEQDQYRAEYDANVAAYKAELDAASQRERAHRDEERRVYKLGIEVARAKGLITLDDYNVIRSCLHPDSRASVSEEKLAAAFRVFNDPRIRALLVKEI